MREELCLWPTKNCISSWNSPELGNKEKPAQFRYTCNTKNLKEQRLFIVNPHSHRRSLEFR